MLVETASVPSAHDVTATPAEVWNWKATGSLGIFPQMIKAGTNNL